MSGIGVPDLIASYLPIRGTGRYATTKLLILIQQCSIPHVPWVQSLTEIQVRLSLNSDKGELWNLLPVQVFIVH